MSAQTQRFVRLESYQPPLFELGIEPDSGHPILRTSRDLEIPIPGSAAPDFRPDGLLHSLAISPAPKSATGRVAMRAFATELMGDKSVDCVDTLRLCVDFAIVTCGDETAFTQAVARAHEEYLEVLSTKDFTRGIGLLEDIYRLAAATNRSDLCRVIVDLERLLSTLRAEKNGVAVDSFDMFRAMMHVSVVNGIKDKLFLTNLAKQYIDTELATCEPDDSIRLSLHPQLAGKYASMSLTVFRPGSDDEFCMLDTAGVFEQYSMVA